MKPVVLTPPDERWKAAEQPLYIAPQTSAARFAAYPSGGPPATVVLDVSVNRAGEVTRTAAVYNVPSLTKDVVAATAGPFCQQPSEEIPSKDVRWRPSYITRH